MDTISSSAGNDWQDLEKNRFHKIKGERFMVYCDLPVTPITVSKYKSAMFTISGNPDDTCILRIVSNSKLRHSDFLVVKLDGKESEILTSCKINDLGIEYQVNGDAAIKIRWV